MTRKQFLTLGAACVALPILVAKRSLTHLQTSGHVRLLPVEGVTYSKSFRRFMERARFDSPRHAMLAVQSQVVEYEIAFVEEDV